MSRPTADPFRCSFCGKHQDEVKKLLGECVAVAKKLVKDSSSTKPATWPVKPKPPRS